MACMTLYTGCSKKRIPNFIFGITSVIQHRFQPVFYCYKQKFMARRSEVLPPTALHCVTTLPSKTNTVKATVVSENRQHIKISISWHKIVKLTYLFAVVPCDIIVTSYCVYFLCLPVIIFRINRLIWAE